MYEQPSRWNEFYREADLSKRRKALDMLCMQYPDDGANAYRYLLLKRRYTDPKDEAHEVDYYLFHCVNFGQVYRSAKLFRKKAAKEIREITAALGFDQAGRYGEAGERALYWEIRNGASRFFATCVSPLYNRAMFGMISSTEGGRRDQMIKDVWAMTHGVIARTGCLEELSVWEKAVLDEFSATFPEAVPSFREYGLKMKDR